jgi:hypothetical protein
MLESVFKTAIKSTDPKLLNAIAQQVANERGNPNASKESTSELRFKIFTAQKPMETSFGIPYEGVARADNQVAWLEATSTLAGNTSQNILNSNYYDSLLGPNSKSKKDFDLDDLENLFGELSNGINPAFIEEFNRLGGSSGAGFSAGSTNTEKSFNPLTEITTLKNGLVVSSLNSFFKVADIKNPEMKKFAEGLLKNDQWGAYSRAFDDLFIHALKNDGLDPKKDKEEMSSKISTYIAQTAKLLNDSINNSGKEISTQNRALASSFIATHFSVDGIAEKLGFDADTIKKYQEGDKHFLLSEALMENPKILQDPEKMNLLTDHLSSLIKDNYDSKLSQYSKDYNGNELKTIESGMIGLLTGKYKDEVAKLNGGQAPSEAQIKAFMSQAGFKANSKDYFKIGNSEIAAQTYLNLKAIEHDHALLKQGKLTDENRMFNSAQTNLRLTPTAAADHNGAFNELNSGRNSMAVAGMNRDQVANIAVPFVNKDQVGGILDKMKDLDIKLSSVDISLHGYQQGTSEFSIADKEGLLKNLADRMSDGGEILYNSCLTGRGTEEGANNLALNTLMTAAKDKGLKVHAADNETIGYQEDTVYDAFSRLIANTPRKLDGIVGGYTIQEGGKEEISNREDTSKKQIAEYIRSKKEQES